MLTDIDPSPPPEPYPYSENGNSAGKRKRRPAGTPDPDAEVVSLSPKTLLESDQYVCEICKQGFQRDQNLQMHRRRHKVPWKLLKRETPTVRKRVFVCPEPSCLHHDPRHALGDLVGIKKHFRRKHSNQKQWVCEKCSKGYAVQSDYKAHLKTCGTRGHSCDCGRVFSRVESFIEHQDACTMGRLRSEHHHLTAAPSSPSSSHTSLSVPHLSNLPSPIRPIFLTNTVDPPKSISGHPNLELQLLTNSSSSAATEKPARLIPQLRIASAEKAYADEARRQAKRQIEAAEKEFADAKRIRRQAQAELEKSQALRSEATEKVNSAVMQVTCHACKHKWSFFAETNSSNSSSRHNFLGLGYVWEVYKKSDRLD
ncbi:hypothetical protein CASFOL_000870 [Castilleja foliolosa]|uniref:C2H2-type domain-containing protein n=1 Tax=Castilleja foliolosa TaxID=1961234 RepID=A0ABD3EPR3_9LAMI